MSRFFGAMLKGFENGAAVGDGILERAKTEAGNDFDQTGDGRNDAHQSKAGRVNAGRGKDEEYAHNILNNSENEHKFPKSGFIITSAIKINRAENGVKNRETAGHKVEKLIGKMLI